MAAIVFAGSASRTTSNTGTLNAPMPPGSAAGDLLLMAAGVNADTPPVFTAPASPTSLQAGSFGTAAYGGAYRRLLTAAEASGEVAFNTTAAAPTARLTLAAVLYRGHDATTPIAASATSVEATTTDTHTTPDLVLPAGTFDGRTIRIVHVVIEKSSYNNGWVLPTGVTRRAEALATNPGSTSSIVADQTDVVIPASSTTAQRTFPGKAFKKTLNGAAVTSPQARMMQIAVLAAADAGGITPNTAVAYAAQRVDLVGVGHLDPSFTYQWTQLEGPVPPGGLQAATSSTAWYMRPYRLRARQVFRLAITGSGVTRTTDVTVRANREIEGLTADATGSFV